jgi:putative phosphonate transport system ATP-binding protein
LSEQTPQNQPLLRVENLTKRFGRIVACEDINFDIWPGEVLAVVGESGSGKTTLLNCISRRVIADSGRILYNSCNGEKDIVTLGEPALRRLAYEEWGHVHQNARDGLRMGVSAGANIGERLMAVGARHYGNIRSSALEWMNRVEMAKERIDDFPRHFSGGMQQRLQIARNLVNGPRLIFMDEPTGGLDVSVQARLLDLLRSLVRRMHLSAIVVTHDLAVARLLSSRMIVMRYGNIVEEGLTDQVLDDPQHAYSQLLVSSILQP